MFRPILRMVLAPMARLLVIAGGAYCGFGVIAVLSQDYLINPAVLSSANHGQPRTSSELPAGVVSVYVESGAEKLELWKMQHPVQEGVKPTVALIFHGNGETVENSLWLLHMLFNLGFDSYVFDYRGYGRSTGHPSEAGFYADSTAVRRYIEGLYSVRPQYLYWGSSLGSGFASYQATIDNPEMLVLISPYSSLPDVVREQPWYGPLHPFLWWRVPTIEYLRALRDTCILVAHGDRDTVIGVENSLRIMESLTGGNAPIFIRDPEANHWDIIGRLQTEIAEGIRRCPGLAVAGK